MSSWRIKLFFGPKKACPVGFRGRWNRIRHRLGRKKYLIRQDDMTTRPVQNEVDVGKLTGPDIFPWFGSIEVHWYHFRRNPTIFRRAHGPQSFRVFYPILAYFNHKATYRRQTINILLGNVGLLCFWFHPENIPFLKNENFEKYFWIFFLKNISKPIFYISSQELSICLSTFQEPFSDPKSDTIYLLKIAVQNHLKPAKIAFLRVLGDFELRFWAGKLYPILDLKTVPER